MLTSACVLYRSSGNRVVAPSGSDLKVLPEQKPETFLVSRCDVRLSAAHHTLFVTCLSVNKHHTQQFITRLQLFSYFSNSHTITHTHCETPIFHRTYVVTCHHIEMNLDNSFDCVIISDTNNINSC